MERYRSWCLPLARLVPRPRRELQLSAGPLAVQLCIGAPTVVTHRGECRTSRQESSQESASKPTRASHSPVVHGCTQEVHDWSTVAHYHQAHIATPGAYSTDSQRIPIRGGSSSSTTTSDPVEFRAMARQAWPRPLDGRPLTPPAARSSRSRGQHYGR